MSTAVSERPSLPAGLEFTAPGPGTWTTDPVHDPRPVTRFKQELDPEPFTRGFSETMARYGVLIGTMQPAFLHGFAYNTMLPVPPGEVPGRLTRAAEVFERKLWRDDLRRWDEEEKPKAIARSRELLATDPDALSNDDLLAHLDECRVHQREMIYQHMRHTAPAVVPTGDFMTHAIEWTGLPPSQLIPLLRGSAPVSSGDSDDFDGFLAAVRDDEAAQQLLASGADPGAIVAGLRALPGETGAVANAYLDLVGHRLVDGFDIGDPTLLELPEVLVKSLRTRLAEEDGRAGDAGLDDLTSRIRAVVPDDKREEFDALLAEARLTYRLRDERGVFTDVWAAGITRRAALAAGRRLAASGRIEQPEHFVEASFDEMRSLLTDNSGPSARELAERARFRTTYTIDQVPQLLGDPPSPPPDVSGLPPAAARMMRSMGFVLQSLFGSSEAPNEPTLVRGIPASPGAYEGTARIVRDPREFDRLVQGDVLVTPSTSEAFNVLLPLLGAIVTDAGGLLSHAAIVAREYGMPAVVGTREGTALIPEGARVRVDGTKGEVSVLT
jgi:pyruvate,water dikinase